MAGAQGRFLEFLALFLPSLINWLLPAFIMSFAVPGGRPHPPENAARVKDGGIAICATFAATIVITVIGRQWLEMPAAYGMLTGLALLNVLAMRIDRRERSYALGQGVQGDHGYSA